MEHKRKVEKIDNYSKYVKEMYWPKVSSKKQQELESLKIKNLKYNRRSVERSPEQLMKKGSVPESGYERPWRAAITKEGRQVSSSNVIDVSNRGMPKFGGADSSFKTLSPD